MTTSQSKLLITSTQESIKCNTDDIQDYHEQSKNTHHKTDVALICSDSEATLQDESEYIQEGASVYNGYQDSASYVKLKPSHYSAIPKTPESQESQNLFDIGMLAVQILGYVHDGNSGKDTAIMKLAHEICQKSHPAIKREITDLLGEHHPLIAKDEYKKYLDALNQETISLDVDELDEVNSVGSNDSYDILESCEEYLGSSDGFIAGMESERAPDEYNLDSCKTA